MATPDFLTPPPALPVPLSDPGRASRIGFWALAIGLGSFLLWAVLAPLDEGVPSQGFVAIDTKHKVVQHLSGGIVKEVLVGEGDLVHEGQLLFRLDDAAARASLESVRQRYLGLRATQGRLQAAQAGLTRIVFHPDLVAAAPDPLIDQQMRNQEQLLESGRAALRAELQSIEAGIQGQEAQVASYEAMQVHRRSQLALLNEELVKTREVVKEGYVPRNRQLELERQVADAGNTLAELQGNLLHAKHSIEEMRQRARMRQQEYRKEFESQLADVTREVLGDAQKVQSLQDELARTDILAPAAGQVVSLMAQTVGGVISPGQKLLDIVPANSPMLLETRVQPNLIDRVRAGMLVDVRFTSFSHAPQLVVQGKLVSVSGDLLTDPQTNAPYYLARVAVTPDGIKALGKHQMQPGMPVEVVFRTGERSLLTYLLHPLSKRLASAMKEE
jgi:protease secretion system membrane fusion protein